MTTNELRDWVASLNDNDRRMLQAFLIRLYTLTAEMKGSKNEN